MKISIESYGSTYSTEMGEGATVDMCFRAFVNPMKSTSYVLDKPTLDRIFVDGDPNNWETAWGPDE